ASGRTEDQDVRLLQLDLVVLLADLVPLVVVVHGDRENLLRGLLCDDVVVEELVDLARLRQFLEFQFGGLGELFLDDLVAEVDALVADVHAGAGDELLHLLLRLPAERTLQKIGIPELRHLPAPRSSKLCRRAFEPPGGGPYLTSLPRPRQQVPAGFSAT